MLPEISISTRKHAVSAVGPDLSIRRLWRHACGRPSMTQQTTLPCYGRWLWDTLWGQDRRSGIVAIAAMTGMLLCSPTATADEDTAGTAILTGTIDAKDAREVPEPDHSDAEQTATANPRTIKTLVDWNRVLPVLAASPERMRLIANIDAYMRQGDQVGAKQLLATVTDVCGLAVTLDDHLHETSLQAALQKMAANGPSSNASVLPLSSVTGAVASEAGGNSASEALERDRKRADATQRQLDRAREEIEILKAEKSRTVELSSALEQEKKRAASIASDLKLAQDRLASAGSSEDKVVKLREAIIKERDRADTAQSALAAAQGELGGLRSNETQLSALKDELQEERKRAALIADTLTSVKTQFVAFQTRAFNAESALRQEQETSAVALRNLHLAIAELAALEAPRSLNPARVVPDIPPMQNEPPAFVSDNKKASQESNKDKRRELSHKARQAALPAGSRALGEATGRTGPPHDVGNRAIPRDRKLSAKLIRRPHVLIQNGMEIPNGDDLDLPTILLPDTRYWQTD